MRHATVDQLLSILPGENCDSLLTEVFSGKNQDNTLRSYLTAM